MQLLTSTALFSQMLSQVPSFFFLDILPFLPFFSLSSHPKKPPFSPFLYYPQIVYFVDEDVFNFSLSKFSVKHTNTLLLLKTNFAQVPSPLSSFLYFPLIPFSPFSSQVLHEWSIQRESSLSQFVVISVFGADVSGTHSTPLSTSHHFYRHLVMR